MTGWFGHIAHSFIHAGIAALLACNYLSFQVELFQDEYEANQPMRSGTEAAISSPTLTWESFDKDHAQKPCVVKALVQLDAIPLPRPVPVLPLFEEPPRQLIRDKSPPEHFV